LFSLLIASLGLATVLAGILWWRIHPLLAMLLGGLAVLLLTPVSRQYDYHLQRGATRIESLDDEGRFYLSDWPAGAGWCWLLRPEDGTGRLELRGEVQLQTAPRRGPKHWRLVPPTPTAKALPLLTGDMLITAEGLRLAKQQAGRGAAERLADAMAGTFRSVGLPISLAAIIGVCLLASGAAQRVVTGLTGIGGERRLPLAMLGSGFLLGIPVYFDTVFYLLLPLAKAAYRSSRQNYLLLVLAVVVGGTMAHSLVPPTPGPLLVAAQLGVDLGTMIVAGSLVGLTASSVGYAYAWWCDRYFAIEPTEAVLAATENSPTAADGGEPVETREPPLSVSLLPILLPLVLLGGASLHSALTGGPDAAEPLGGGLWSAATLGRLWGLAAQPVLVLLMATLLAVGLSRWSLPRGRRAAAAGNWVARGLADAGTIVLLTCAGGAFGQALQQLGLATDIQQRLPQASTGLPLLGLAFVLTAVIRAAQGSATVAMITAVGIMTPLVVDQPLPFHPVYVALAIGCGSKMLPWMNDSGFWQVGQLSGLSVTQTLQTFSVALTLMGLAGFAITLAAAWSLPMIPAISP